MTIPGWSGDALFERLYHAHLAACFTMALIERPDLWRLLLVLSPRAQQMFFMGILSIAATGKLTVHVPFEARTA